ncbi:DNA primase [Algihabitans albus]|uniref:DNA primase n=1 Tax=Algihabitans albus TaxID=2164067 RepID=UPI0013C2DE48|nr:DNA primase [Algihabitans albus]
MAFPPDFLDELRSRVSLIDLIGRRVPLKKRGREWVGLSPFQSEKSPSFTVVPDKGFFHCFSSGEHGDAIGWVMRIEGLSFPEAVEKLAGEAGLQVPRPTPEAKAEAEKRKSIYEVLELACSWFEQQLGRSWGEEAKRYLQRRGLSEPTIERFRLGYAPNDRGILLKYLKMNKVDVELAAAAGLVKIPEGGGEPRDYFFNRVLFPIADRQGRIIGFGGRTLEPDGKPKYLNTPETAVFRKGRSLYNLDRARKTAHETGEVIVAEGYMDVIALDQAGFSASVAPLGTAVTEEQIAELWRLAPEPLICLDGDQAGQKAGMRVAERALPGLQPGRSLRFALLPAGDDPDSLLSAQGPKALRQVLDAAKPLSDLVWLMLTAGRDLATPERRAGLRQDILRLTGGIADEGVKAAYREELLARYDEAYGFGSRRRQRSDSRPEGRSGRARGGYRDQREPIRTAFDRPAPALLRRRPEQMLLACALNHPELAAEDCETLAAVQLSSADFDRLRRAITDALANQPDLDSDTLQGHLSQLGFTGVLAAVLSEPVYLHAPFARSNRPLAEARHGWRDLMERLWSAQQASEEIDTVRQLAADMREDSLQRLRAHQQLSQKTDPGLRNNGKAEPGESNADVEPTDRGE